MVQEYADSEDADKQEDKVMAQRLLDILYATEDGFAVPAGDNEEFWGNNYTMYQGVTEVYSSEVTLSAHGENKDVSQWHKNKLTFSQVDIMRKYNNSCTYVLNWNAKKYS